jgi:hypothetical protein
VRATIELPAAWPGWSATHTLVLPIDPRDWPPPSLPLDVDGHRFAPKQELHVTVVGKALGARLRAAIEGGRIDEAALRHEFAGQRWRLRRSGERVRLRKPAPDAAIESIIEPVALPAMARWHAWLGRALGEALPVPPPHVTLYVRGDAEGIGVPDEATLARLRVG